MKRYRMNRLFHPQSARCLDVAIDHGFFNEPSFLHGIEDIESAVESLVQSGPDAIQLTVGQADVLQRIPGKQKPSLVLRSDVANVYGKTLPNYLFSRMIEDPVGQAVRLDAVCVVVNLFSLPESAELSDQCVQNILRLKPMCDDFAMPMMVEPLVFRDNHVGGGYMVDGDPEKIVPLVRQAVELGADIIKADPTDNVSDYKRVREVCRVPLLVRGGGRAPDEEVLQRTESLIQVGVDGIVYGRNIVQHPKPPRMVQALMAIVHDGSTAIEAHSKFLE